MYIYWTAKQQGKYPLFHQHWVEIVLVYTTQQPKEIAYSCQYTKEWLEIELLMHDFVSSAAQKWIVLANHLQTSLSAWMRRTIHLCGIY